MNRKCSRVSYKKELKNAYQELKRAYQEVRDSYSDMIFRFALTAEYKDDTTGTHLVRIADYCTAIAEELGLSKKEVDNLRYASLMHDIGKLLISDEILKKKTGLTPDEMNTIKKHTTMGADIFKGSRSPILQDAQTVIATHHEKYDGTGYPRGLKGKDIPLLGRIVALADVFDTLTSERPYKKAFGFDKATDMIKRQSGKHFDPAVVNAFLRTKDKIRKLWKATQDIHHFIEQQKEVP